MSFLFSAACLVWVNITLSNLPTNRLILICWKVLIWNAVRGDVSVDLFWGRHAAGMRGSSLHGWIHGVPLKELTDAEFGWIFEVRYFALYSG